jgi:hypothetical protein
MNLLLVRHGLVNQTGELNRDGKNFAKKLIQLIPNPNNIDYICSDEEQRCIETISPLASDIRLEKHTFTKGDFANSTPLKNSLQHNYAIICYRIESINTILQEIGLPQFNNNNRDEAYEFIYNLQIEKNRLKSTNKIPTGYKKI